MGRHDDVWRRRVPSAARMLLLAALVGLAACSSGGMRDRGGEDPFAKKSTADADVWVLVEEDADRAGVTPGGARYPTGSKVLVYRRMARKTAAVEDVHVRVQVLGGSEVAEVGSEVEVLVWVERPDPAGVYEMRVEPTSDTVRVSPATTYRIRGGEKVRIRYTSTHEGPAGVRIRCRKIGEDAKH